MPSPCQLIPCALLALVAKPSTSHYYIFRVRGGTGRGTGRGTTPVRVQAQGGRLGVQLQLCSRGGRDPAHWLRHAPGPASTCLRHGPHLPVCISHLAAPAWTSHG